MSINSALSEIQKAKSTQQKQIYLNFHDLAEIPSELWDLTDITHLFLTGNQITEVPQDIQKLIHLQHLDMSGNKFKYFPDAILNLETLNTLDISSNTLISLPDNIRKLRNLTALDCFDNNLTELPETLGDCLNLTNLMMGKNEITSLPKTIGKLIHLNTLDASYNEISQLPSSFLSLTNLENLDLSGNKIDLPFGIFDKYQYEPGILLEQIRSLQYQKSHVNLDKYRKQKVYQSTTTHVNSLDSLLEKFSITNNQLQINAIHSSTSKNLHNIAEFLDAINNDLLIIWAITHSIQGIKDKHNHADQLMGYCYNNYSLTTINIDKECNLLINKIQSHNEASKKQPPIDYPKSEVIDFHSGKNLSVTCQLSASRRTLLYLSYLWALNSLSLNSQINKQPKKVISCLASSQHHWINTD